MDSRARRAQVSAGFNCQLQFLYRGIVGPALHFTPRATLDLRAAGNYDLRHASGPVGGGTG